MYHSINHPTMDSLGGFVGCHFVLTSLKHGDQQVYRCTGATAKILHLTNIGDPEEETDLAIAAIGAIAREVELVDGIWRLIPKVLRIRVDLEISPDHPSRG